MSIADSHDRRISYLRLSVTDRCNLRCHYCMPQDGTTPARLSLLSLDDLYRVAQQAAILGIQKIRVTGGEPLLRSGIVPFLGRISAISGIK